MADSSSRIPNKIREFPIEENPPRNYLHHERGLMSWLFTLDHKRIGLMYLGFIVTSFFIGGVLAVVLRTEIWTTGGTFIDADTYNHIFTLHGVTWW